MSRAERNRAQRGHRRHRLASGFAIAALIVVIVAAVFLGSKLWHSFSGPSNDYRGDGKRDLVIEVHTGDSTTAIAETLHTHGVVKTVKAFVDAAHGNSKISAIQPGFYKTRTEIPASSAVTRLVDPNNRVGRLVIPEGRQLDDTTDMKSNAVTDGIFSLISKASCVDLDGDRRCVNVDDLRAAAGTGPLAALSVPPWATQQVTAMGDDHRRVEGLIAPGTWNVNPSASAQKILGTLIADSAASYAQSGLQDTATALNMTPYDVLVVAALVQREAKPQDFPKVARVIYNRLNEHRSLEFDSTVNYPLDRREVATTDADRAQHTPWNTYLLHGLPATPICSPGVEALGAAERPAEGDWLYFVTIDDAGTTLFTRDYQQHLANIELARRNGVLDSTR
ncbi:endolytic transglycosylase MltG [Mycobacterium sp. pUA109]|uniref:endolytic transglycosylase MltG n=1 Tax=Mycobacterium sp. pUA109 TaxID=3238982 RepID=UPI00351B2649